MTSHHTILSICNDAKNIEFFSWFFFVVFSAITRSQFSLYLYLFQPLPCSEHLKVLCSKLFQQNGQSEWQNVIVFSKYEILYLLSQNYIKCRCNISRQTKEKALYVMTLDVFVNPQMTQQYIRFKKSSYFRVTFSPQSSQIWNQDPRHQDQLSALHRCCCCHLLTQEAEQDCRLLLEDWRPQHDDDQSDK